MTADGRVLRAVADSQPGPLSALHGGGGNFGVVDLDDAAAASLGPVTVALLLWEPEEA